MKNISVQVSENNCDNCRFNITSNEEGYTRYCLAYLKAILKDEFGKCIPISDCKDIGEKNNEV